MADISKITTPDGTTYDIKDAVARTSVLDNLKTDGTLSISRCGKLRTLYINKATFTAAAFYTLASGDRPIRNVWTNVLSISSTTPFLLFVSNTNGAIGLVNDQGSYVAGSKISACITYMTA